MSEGAPAGVDIASLAISIDSYPAITAEQALDKLTVTAKRAEEQAKRLKEETEKQMRGFSAAADAIGEMDRRVAALRGSVDPFYSLQRKLNQEMAEANQLYKLGALGSLEYAQSMRVLTDRMKVAEASQLVYLQNQGHIHKSMRLTGNELLNMSRQFADVGVTMAMGMNPLMILVQQGPQIADVFAQAAQRGVGFKAALAGIVEMVAPFAAVAAAIGAVAVVVGTLAAAYLAGEKDANKFANAIQLTGNYANVTAQQYEDMISTVARATNASMGDTRKVMLALVASGQFTRETIEQLAPSIIQISQLSGKTKEDVAQSFLSMGSSVTDFATKLNENYHLISAAQMDHIRLLEEQGRTTEAQLYASMAIHKELAERGTENLGYLEQAWRGVGNAISWAWEQLKKWGQASDVSQQLTTLNATIAEREGQAKGAGVTPNSQFIAAQAKRELGPLYAQREALQLQLEQREAAAATTKAQDEAAEATRRMTGQWSGLADSTERATRAITQYRSDIAKIRAVDPTSSLLPSAKQQAEAEEAIRKRYTPNASRASSQAETASEREAKAAQRRAEALGREAEAQEATISGNLALAAAYGVSGAAAQKQAATTKATTAAIKAQGDIDAFVARQIRLSVSEQAVAGAKRMSDLKEETSLRAEYNSKVAAGTMTQQQAAVALRDEASLRPLLAAEALAEGDAKTALTKIISDLRAQMKLANDEEARGQLLAAKANQQDHLAYLKIETDMIGKSNRERAVMLAQLQAEQQLRQMRIDPKSAEGAAFVKDAGDLGGRTYDLAQAQDTYNQSLGYTAELLDQIDQHARDAAEGLASVFEGISDDMGRVTKAFGSVITSLTGLRAKEEQIAKERKARQKDQTKDSAVWRQAEVVASRESAKARVEAYGDMASAAKMFFEEGSDGYRAMQAVEAGFRAFQMAMSIQAMLRTAAEAGAHVAANTAVAASDATLAAQTLATDAVTTSSGIAAGAARMFAKLGPYAFPVVAAMVATMAALGASGGGGGVPQVSVSERRQREQGAGSVLGDAEAKSESIANSLEIVASNTNRELEYSNSMLRALQSIDNQIGAVAAAIARSFGAGGMLDTSKLGLGTTSTGPSGLMKLFNPLSALLPGLFGTTKSTTLQDQGVQFGSGSLDAILNGGLTGSAYQQVSTNTKKKFFGITYSDKTKNSTSTTALDADFLRQTELLIGSLRDGVLAAAGTLGVEGAAATLAAFQVNLGKLSFKDMTGSEIQTALEGIFGKLADDMAGAVMPGLKDLQNVGEGLFETLSRVARQYQVIDITLSTIGKTFGTVGVSSLEARERLVDLFGSLDEFVDQTSYYAENFLTEAERLSPINAAVTAELARLGLTGVKTRDQFKAVVQGLDLSTAAGAELYAALMALAPGFAAITEETKAVSDARDQLSEAYERESDALLDTADRFKALAEGLGDYRQSLYSGPAAVLSPEAQYAAAKAEFDRVSALAGAGNEDALGSLQSVSEAYLDASRDYFASSQGYFADLARVREAVTAAEGYANTQVTVAEQQLEQLKAMVDGFLDLNQTLITVPEALANLQALLGGNPAIPAAAGAQSVASDSGTANDNQEIVDELAALNEQLAADKAQRGAIGTETLDKLDAVQQTLQRLLREIQAG